MTRKKQKPVVVVVNDDPIQLRILSGLLPKAGIHPLAYESAETALASMSFDHPPDLLITDLYMPGIDGWRFCRLLRSSEYAAFNKIPIMVVSATFAGEHPERIAKDIGADVFLSVPVDREVFLAQVVALLQRQDAPPLPRALIVEDDQGLAGLLEESLVAAGYRVDRAVTSDEARATFAGACYDVAVLDYHLPDGTGETLLDAFRAERPGCVYLMMTGDPTPELALSWMKRGASAYLRKPFEPQYLVELCARARRERALLRVEELLEMRTRQLRGSEQQFRIAMNNLPGSVWTIDRELRFTLSQGGRLTQIGLRPDEVVGMTLYEFFGTNDRSHQAISHHLRALSGESLSYEYTHKNITFMTYVSPIHDPQGDVSGVLGLAVDITERKQTEETLQRRLKYEHCVAECIKILTGPESPDRMLSRVVSTLRVATDADRAYVFRHEEDAAGEPTMTQTHESCAKDVEPQINNEQLQHLPYSAGAPSLLPVLLSRRAFTGIVADLEGAEREILASQSIVSIAVLPIFSSEALWGFIGLDDCRIPREWTDDDVQMLASLADVIGVALERKKAEEALRESEKKYRVLFDIFPLGITVSDSAGKIIESNAAAERLLGIPKDEQHKRHIDGSQWRIIRPDGTLMPAAEYASVRALKENQQIENVEMGIVKPDEEITWINVSAAPLNLDGYGVVITYADITDRKRADEEHENLLAQLAQAQKMESIGLLAGGIAHDFNNMLGVILGHAELAMNRLAPGDLFRDDLQEIRNAAQRSANLTRQLLAFARKQPIAPTVIDFNAALQGMLTMLKRLIGEEIDLVWNPGRRVWPARIDPTQLDQILANLCVNARDAIAGTGKIIIETRNISCDDAYCDRHAGFAPGDYVMLAVSDDGCGMDADTLSRLFEPFFTTKEMGKGSGLGLPGVYGAVKQNNGFINVYSEPGQGTTVKIYLPRHAAKEAQEKAKRRRQAPTGGNETILLVEDEPAILRMATTMLEKLGYAVLTASTPGEAIRLATEYPGHIDLVMTDVVMPQMNGSDLVERLLTIYPEIKRLFMSGYTADVILHRGVLDKEMHFIQKPFSMADLTAKLRNVLET